MYRDDATLLDIARAARKIASYLRGVEREAFFANDEKQSAVLYQLAVIGEAVKRFSPGFRGQHADIPWQKIAGMRDRVIHGYDQVNLGRVWSAATHDVPDLLVRIEPLMPVELPPDDSGTQG